MTLKIDNAIEEIERALAGNKPKYANDIYLNNAIRYLQEIKSPSLTDDQQAVLEWLKEEYDRSPNTLRGFNRIHMGTLTPIGDETTVDCWERLTEKQQFQVLAAFASYGSEEER